MSAGGHYRFSNAIGVLGYKWVFSQVLFGLNNYFQGIFLLHCVI